MGAREGDAERVKFQGRKEGEKEGGGGGSAKEN